MSGSKVSLSNISENGKANELMKFNVGKVRHLFENSRELMGGYDEFCNRKILNGVACPTFLYWLVSTGRIIIVSMGEVEDIKSIFVDGVEYEKKVGCGFGTVEQREKIAASVLKNPFYDGVFVNEDKKITEGIKDT